MSRREQSLAWSLIIWAESWKRLQHQHRECCLFYLVRHLLTKGMQ